MLYKEKENSYQVLMFTLSVVGILLTYHLHLTKLNPFCLSDEANGCREIINNIKGPFGISYIYWGLLYYLNLTLCSIIPLLMPSKLNFYLIRVRNYSIIFGFIYSMFLVGYQFYIQSFCPLCMISAILFLMLFLLLISSKFLKSHPIPKKTTLKPKLLILLITIGLILGDWWVNKPDPKSIVQEITDPCKLKKYMLKLDQDGKLLYNSPENIKNFSFIITGSNVKEIESTNSGENNIDVKIIKQKEGSALIKMSSQDNVISSDCGYLVDLDFENPSNSDVKIELTDLFFETTEGFCAAKKEEESCSELKAENECISKQGCEWFKELPFKYYDGYHDINMEKSVILGDPEAPITIIEWIDFY